MARQVISAALLIVAFAVALAWLQVRTQDTPVTWEIGVVVPLTGPDAAEAAKLQATVKAYLTKVPKLSAAEFEEQYDDLFDELQAIIDASMPRPTREIMEAQVAEDLGYIFMSERTLALIKALAASRAEG